MPNPKIVINKNLPNPKASAKKEEEHFPSSRGPHKPSTPARGPDQGEKKPLEDKFKPKATGADKATQAAVGKLNAGSLKNK